MESELLLQYYHIIMIFINKTSHHIKKNDTTLSIINFNKSPEKERKIEEEKIAKTMCAISYLLFIKYFIDTI